MSTTSGDIHLDAALSGDGPFAIKSISGDCTIVARAGLQVEAQTITGDLSSRLAHRTETRPGRKILIVGKPVATLIFNSVSGDLSVVEARDGRPADLMVAIRTRWPRRRRMRAQREKWRRHGDCIPGYGAADKAERQLWLRKEILHRLLSWTMAFSMAPQSALRRQRLSSADRSEEPWPDQLSSTVQLR